MLSFCRKYKSAACTDNSSDTAAPRHLLLHKGGQGPAAVLPIRVSCHERANKKAPPSKGSCRSFAVTEGLFIRSFCRIFKLTVRADNPSELCWGEGQNWKSDWKYVSSTRKAADRNRKYNRRA